MLPDSDPTDQGDQNTGGGKVPPASVLPPDHQLGMKVPKGGSMCGNCEYLSGPQNCGNQGYQQWNGSDQLPAPADQYCCDLYEIGKQQGSDQSQNMIKALQSPEGRNRSPINENSAGQFAEGSR